LPIVIGSRPNFSSAGIGNAASYSAGKVSPGEIVVVYGSNFGPSTLAQMQLVDGMVSTTLADTKIYFDGVAAPMIYALGGGAQSVLSCVVPYAVARKATTDIRVEYKGQTSDTLSVPVVDAKPGIFSLSQTGTGQGAILNQDYTGNGVSNPAAAGTVVMVFATGGGQTTPAGMDGKPALGPAYPAPVLQPWTAMVGGKPATVTYAGAAPNMVAGVLQVNVQIPAGLTPGQTELIVMAGNFTSQSGLTVAVK
jgi:uncharacterized protein (TIGR03437 family)